MNTELTVVLLAGGESTRFWPLSNKNEMEFLGKPLISWHYEQLVRIGFSKVIVVVNKTNEATIKHIASPKEMEVTYVVQNGDGQGNAIMAASPVIGKSSALVLNASDYYTDDFFLSYKKQIMENQGTAILGAVKTDSYFPGGYLKTDKSGQITQIIEKPKPGTEPSDIVRINADYFPDINVVADAIGKSTADPHRVYEEAMNDLMKRGVVFKTEITPIASWHHLKYPWDVLPMMDMFLLTMTKQVIHPGAMVKENVVLEGPVIIEDGVKIFEGTKIVGPCYIGKNTIIGNNNIIRSSMIGSDSVTGFNTDITRSYIGRSCWFHSNYVGDSVLGDDISMGSGSVLANLRLDDGMISSVVKEEKIQTGRNKLGAVIGPSVRIGVNTSIMPGIKIGTNSFVAAGITVSQDIPDKSFVKSVSTEIVIEPNTKQAASSREEFRKSL